MPSTIPSLSHCLPSTPDTARVFLSGICLAIGFTQSYENTLGKRVLWMIFLGLVSECSDFYEQSFSQRFINHTIKVMNCEYGVVLATQRDYQMNLNIFIPRSDDQAGDLYNWMIDRLTRDFYDYAIDMRPILRFVRFPVPHTWQRNMLPSPRRLQDLAFDKEHGIVVFQDYSSPITEVITDVRNLSRYRPIQRMTMADDPETLYWHRFACGTIVGFPNPRVEFHEHCRIARPKMGDNMNLTPICKKVVRALEPQCGGECIDVIESKCITVEVRRIFVAMHRTRFGITDELIVAVGLHLGDSLYKESKNLLLAEISIVYEIMRKFSTEPSTFTRLLEGLMNWLERFQKADIWRQWVISSAFVHALVASVSTSSLRRICAGYEILYYPAAATLCSDHPDPTLWNRETTERAHMICEANASDGPYMQTLRNLYEAWNRANVEAFHELSSTETSDATKTIVPTTVPKSSAREEIIVECVDDTVHVDVAETTPETHDNVVARINAEVLKNRYECTLIGSGIFFNGSDVDIVVRVPDADTLENAYDTIQQLTGWKRQYDRVSTERIAVLCGEFDGIKVDAQVWRGVHSLERTRAEEETHRALLLTRTLREKTDERLRGMVYQFHLYMQRVGFKGHTFCRLPGVAVTCIAIVIARFSSITSMHSMLTNIRKRLETDIPCFDIDEEDTHPRTKNRPTCAVQVVINETNVASRMTASITRHLLDTLAWSLHEGVESPRAWRTRHMISCLRMRPVHDLDRTVALTLHSVMSKLDGHPLIDTVYADEHPETGDVLIRVTLRRDTRYGFRGTETLTRVVGTESIVMVSRDGGIRQWPLCTHPCIYASSLAASVTDVNDELFVRVDGDICVPNAPYLMNDLLGYFDVRHWMRVDV